MPSRPPRNRERRLEIMTQLAEADFPIAPEIDDTMGEASIGDVWVGRIGYGAALRVDGRPGTPGTLPEPASVKRLLRRAVELGVGLIDTADSYGPEVSERLIAAALHPYPAGLLISSKAGVVRDGAGQTILDGRPERLRTACEASLRRRRLDAIGLYQLHWPDPAVPFADQVGALAELVRAGKVRQIGLCNVDAEQLAAACCIAPIAAVQHRFGLGEPDATALLEQCRRHGAAFIAYGSLAVLRAGSPAIAGRLAAIAARHGATPAQVALAWVLRRATGTLVIPGTLSIGHLEQNMGACVVKLTGDEMAELVRHG